MMNTAVVELDLSAGDHLTRLLGVETQLHT